jgi:hypothetical protein
MNHETASEQLKAGRVLIDAHGVQWRFVEGRFETRWPEHDVPAWVPFGRSPLPDDAPFRAFRPHARRVRVPAARK